MVTEKDIVVIGGGPGGYVAAIHAAHLGAKVALIEKDRLGGTCLNRGCIPTKALVRTVEVLLDTKRAFEFGVDVSNIVVNFQRVMARKANIVSHLVTGVESLLKINKIALFTGKAHILSPNLIRVNDDEIVARKIVIATGSEPTVLPVPGAYLAGVFTTNEILDLHDIPMSLVIIGGSHVGVEFGGIFNALGTRVTIVEQRPFLLGPVDEEIRRRFVQTLPGQGIGVKNGATVKSIQVSGNLLRVAWDTPNGEDYVEGQLVLMATGRQPYTEGLALSDIGVKVDGKSIVVNEKLETNVEGVYAVGDVLGKHMMAHVASYEGEIAAENALGRSRKVDYTAVPTCVFTIPEVAGVGITEQGAREKGIAIKVSKFPFMVSGRAVALSDTTGMVKMVCDAETGKVVGMHIFGPHASDLIAEGVLAVQMGATARDVAHTIHAHPTLPEAVHEAAMGQLDGAIHYQRL